MKRRLLFSAVVLAMAATAMAQTNITPERYVFAQQPVGQYKIDAVNAGANPPAALEVVKTGWNEGFFLVAGAPAGFTSMDAADTQMLQAGLNIVDMGGAVGKVLCLRGNTSVYEVGNPMTGVPKWYNLNFYTDPNNTPISGDKGATNKIRVRLVFSIFQNTLSETASLLKFYCSTYTNNVIGEQHTNFCSGDYKKLDSDGDPEVDENENLIFDPTQWMVYEFDTWVPEENGAPTRLKIEIPSQGDFTVLFKEIKFMTDVSGNPVQRKIETYNPGPTGIAELSKEKEILYTIEGNSVTFVDNAEIYSISGIQVANLVAAQPVSLTKGFYIAKVGQKSVKFVIE